MLTEVRWQILPNSHKIKLLLFHDEKKYHFHDETPEISSSKCANTPVGTWQFLNQTTFDWTIRKSKRDRPEEILLPPFRQSYYIIFLDPVLKKTCTHFLYIHIYWVQANIMSIGKSGAWVQLSVITLPKPRKYEI